jgi:hypothetical protein
MGTQQIRDFLQMLRRQPSHSTAIQTMDILGVEMDWHLPFIQTTMVTVVWFTMLKMIVVSTPKAWSHPILNSIKLAH